MCYYYKHLCWKCSNEHLRWSSSCENAKPGASCGKQIVLNDGCELGDMDCDDCRQYPYDPTKEANSTKTNQSDEVPSRKYRFLAPMTPSSSSADPKESSPLKSIEGASSMDNTDIRSKGPALAPMKTIEEAEEASAVDKWLREFHFNHVKNLPEREWPKDGQTREQWKQTQSFIRATTDPMLNEEWKGFMEYQRRAKEEEESKSRKW